MVADTNHLPPYELVWNKISGIKFGMLTVPSTGGHLVAMPLTTLQDTFEGAIWFFVARDSDAGKAALSVSEVCLSYASPSDDLYVSLSGRLTEDGDPERRKSLFNVFTKAWFPKGLNDPNLLLIRVDVHTAEYWDVRQNKAVQFMKMAKAVATGSRPNDMGEHGTVSMER